MPPKRKAAETDQEAESRKRIRRDRERVRRASASAESTAARQHKLRYLQILKKGSLNIYLFYSYCSNPTVQESADWLRLQLKQLTVIF